MRKLVGRSCVYLRILFRINLISKMSLKSGLFPICSYSGYFLSLTSASAPSLCRCILRRHKQLLKVLMSDHTGHECTQIKYSCMLDF